jgi:hypothetical protein
VFTIGNTGGVRLAPTSTGSVLDFELEDQWTAGDLMNADFASSTTLTGDVIGLDLNLNTNVTGVADGDLTGINLQTPALTSSGTTTTNYYGNRISAAGTLDTTAAESLVTSINWYGNFIQMPNIDSGEAGDTVTAYGIYLNPGTITDGLGTENLYGIWSEGGDWILDDDGDGLLGGTTGDLFLGEDQDLALYHNGTDSFVLSATNDLFLAADDDSAGSQIQFGLEDGSTVLGYFITGTTNTGDFGVDTDTFYVDASANGVGIGTASPGNKLHLYADGSSDIASADGSLLIIEQDGAGDAGIQFELTGGQIWSIGVDNSSTNDDFAIFDGGTNRFTIDGLVGNIGIGTSTPDHKVEVEGFYGGNALMSLNNTGGTDIFTASASSVTRFIIQTDGSTVAPKFVDLANSA